MDDLARIARRFPLVARPRPACRPLADRIQEVQELADAAAGKTTDDALALAASAHNKAALIASDCGVPELARELCWRQAELYLHAKPLRWTAARYALEPLVNLVRLRIRAGEYQEATEDLNLLWSAVKRREAVVMADHPISFCGITRTDDEHRIVCQWLWGVLLADGTRALVAAGQWERAVAHVERHGGVGQRIMDGRQIKIVDCILTGDPSAALRLLQETRAPSPWEQAVTAALTAYYLRSARRTETRAVDSMVEHYLRLTPEPGLVVFRTRLGMAVIEIAEGKEASARAVDHLLTEALASEDGYVARDALADVGLRPGLTAVQQRELRAVMESAHLDQGYLPDRHMKQLLAGVESSEERTAKILQGAEGLRALPSRPAGDAR
ncbi:hypothetical protein [Actinomadura nitritigenes]|uniref:hypothetical protein n=1 Tax=Actinomadura nitritigenes TaxID=134602 RepID=UPI003D91FB5E